MLSKKVKARSLTLPTGPVWEAAKAEGNWFAYAIVPQPNRKPLKQPANIKNGWAPEDVHKVAFFDFAKAAAGINDLNKRREEINRRRTVKFRSIDAENVKLSAEGKRPRANPFRGEIARFVLGYLPRAGSAMVGLDFDNVLSGDGVAEWARTAIKAAESFTEVSSSGTGIRMLAARHEADAGRHAERRDAGIIATEGKGFALTFDHRSGAPLEILPAPEAIECLIGRMGARSKPHRSSKLKLVAGGDEAVNPVEWLADVFAALPNTLDYDRWVTLGHAFKHSGLPEAFDVFEEFSGRFARGEISEGETAADKWDGFNPQSVGVGTIWHIARELGWDGRNPRPGILPERTYRPDVNLAEAAKRVASGDAEALPGLISAIFFGTNLQGWGAQQVTKALCAVGGVAFDPHMFDQIEARWLAWVDDLMSGAADLRQIEKTRAVARRQDILLAAREMTDEVIANRFLTVAQRLKSAQIAGAIAFLESLQTKGTAE